MNSVEPFKLAHECVRSYHFKENENCCFIRIKTLPRFKLLWLNKLRALTAYENEIEYCLSPEGNAPTPTKTRGASINMLEHCTDSFLFKFLDNGEFLIEIEAHEPFASLWGWRLTELMTNMKEVEYFAALQKESDIFLKKFN